MLLSPLLSSKLLHPRPRLPFVSRKRLTTTGTSFISASKRDSYGHHYDGKLVDENMILLRMRIRDIETKEVKSGEAPSDWTDWEKKCFKNYGSDICDAVGLLQRWLMNTRPCLALGMLTLLMLSVSLSTSLVVFYLVELAQGTIFK